MQTSTVTLQRDICAASVEAVLRREDIRFFKRLVRGERAARGTQDWFYDVQDIELATQEFRRCEMFRLLAARYLKRIPYPKGFVRPRKWTQADEDACDAEAMRRAA